MYSIKIALLKPIHLRIFLQPPVMERNIATDECIHNYKLCGPVKFNVTVYYTEIQ